LGCGYALPNSASFGLAIGSGVLYWPSVPKRLLLDLPGPEGFIHRRNFNGYCSESRVILRGILNGNSSGLRRVARNSRGFAVLLGVSRPHRDLCSEGLNVDYPQIGSVQAGGFKLQLNSDGTAVRCPVAKFHVYGSNADEIRGRPASALSCVSWGLRKRRNARRS